jgi:hypothetical protein
VVVLVTPDGRCHQGWSGSPSGDDGLFPPLPVGPLESDGTILDKKTAILLATSYAVRRGLIPAETRVEAGQARDGSWLFAFYPGPSRANEDTGVLPAVPPFVILVTRNGECRTFPKDTLFSVPARAFPKPIQVYPVPIRAE